MLHSPDLAFLALALSLVCGSSSAKPILQIREPALVSIDFAIRLNLTLGDSKIADLDRARAASKLAGIGNLVRRDGAISATNTGVTYVANIGVGEPAADYSLVVDTGSSNTWIGNSKRDF